MLTLLGISLFAVGVAATNPPDISGQWRGEDWGQVALRQTSPGEYTGTYSETVGKGPGKIELKWSRIERQFNGTWSEGEDRFGDLSIRLADEEIRGALTTDPKSKINPATPRLAPFVWTRAGVPGTVSLANAPHAHALHFDQSHYAVVPPSTKFTSGDFTISLWLKPASSGRRIAPQTQHVIFRGYGYREQRGDIGLMINQQSGDLDFVAYGDNGNGPGWIFGWDESRLHSPIHYDQWNHVVVTRSGDIYRMWVNGARARTEYSFARISDADNTNPFKIGCGSGDVPGGVGGLLLGDIDDFRIFRRCLADKEIGTLYDCNGDETSLQGEGRVKVGPLRAAYMQQEPPGNEELPQAPRPTRSAPHGHAVQFDGEHYATVRQPPKFTADDFTISVWFEPVRASEWALLFMRGFGYRDQRGDIGLKFNIHSGNLDFQARTADNDWLFGWDVPESRLRSLVDYGRWNHVVITRCGDTYAMWMNGTRVGSEKSSADISDADNTNPFIVGGMMSNGGVSAMFQGALDDFRIFRRCLSDKEIGSLYDCNGDETSLQGEGRVKIGPLIRGREMNLRESVLSAPRVGDAARSASRTSYIQAPMSNCRIWT